MTTNKVPHLHICTQKGHVHTLKTLQHTSEPDGLWKCQNNQASTESVLLGVFKATTLDTDTAGEKKNNSAQATGLLTCCWRRIPSFCFGSCAWCELPILSSPSRQMTSSSSSGQALPPFLPLRRCWAHSSPPLADQMNLNASSASLRPLGARQK